MAWRRRTRSFEGLCAGAVPTVLAGVPAGSRVLDVGCGAELPIAAGSFDVVLANFVLNRVDDPRLGIRELALVAAPGGTVRATIWPGYPPPQARLEAVAADR